MRFNRLFKSSNQKNAISMLGASMLMFGIAISTSAQAEDGYGDIIGRIVLQGDVPKLRLLDLSRVQMRNKADCGTLPFTSQSLVVNPRNHGIRNVFVYLRKIHSDKVHPKLLEPKQQDVKLRLKNCRIHPHTMVVRTNQQVVIEPDSDAGHNIHPYPIFNNQFGPLIRPAKPGQPINVARFMMKEPLPIHVKCDIHAWMQAYWLVIDHPYAATTDANGTFTIEKLPEGEHSLTIWHERIGYIEKAFRIDVSKDKRVDLGAYEVPLDHFEIRDDELQK